MTQADSVVTRTVTFIIRSTYVQHTQAARDQNVNSSPCHHNQSTPPAAMSFIAFRIVGQPTPLILLLQWATVLATDRQRLYIIQLSWSHWHTCNIIVVASTYAFSVVRRTITAVKH